MLNLYEWKTLVGALLGAATPISLWFLRELYKEHANHKEYLYCLERIIGYNINGVIDARNTINHFIKNRLPKLIRRIDQSGNSYFVGSAFLPLFTVHPINEDVFKSTTGSVYLDDKMIQLFKISKDFMVAIDDLRQQFIYTVDLNREIATKKLNTAQQQNNEYKMNIQEFIKTVEQDLFEKNIKTYIQVLSTARISINTLQNIGLPLWKFKFEGHFKFFKNKRDFKEFRSKTFERIDKFLEEKVAKQIEEIEREYD